MPLFKLMTLLQLQQIDPVSEKYIFPPAKTTKDLVRLLLARQRKVFGQMICETQSEFTERILQRNFKLLLNKYDIKLILRGIELSVLLGNFPGSTQVVENMIEYYLDLKIL